MNQISANKKSDEKHFTEKIKELYSLLAFHWSSARLSSEKNSELGNDSG